MSGNETSDRERICLWCGDPIPEEVLFIDEGAECCSVECMEEYGAQLIANFINYDGGTARPQDTDNGPDGGEP